MQASKEALFFTLNFFSPGRGVPQSKKSRKYNKKPLFLWGEKNENKNHIGMYRMQAEKLQYDQRKKEPSGQNGNHEVLQILQEAYHA